MTNNGHFDFSLFSTTSIIYIAGGLISGKYIVNQEDKRRSTSTSTSTPDEVVRLKKTGMVVAWPIVYPYLLYTDETIREWMKLKD